MTANERRAEIMRILTARRQESMGRLALELGVTRRTIRSDITALTVDYPLETQRGNGGCVKVADWYHPHRNILSCEQQRVLSELIGICNVHQANVLRQMLAEYGSSQHRTMKGRSGWAKLSSCWMWYRMYVHCQIAFRPLRISFSWAQHRRKKCPHNRLTVRRPSTRSLRSPSIRCLSSHQAVFRYFAVGRNGAH